MIFFYIYIVNLYEGLILIIEFFYLFKFASFMLNYLKFLTMVKILNLF